MPFQDPFQAPKFITIVSEVLSPYNMAKLQLDFLFVNFFFISATPLEPKRAGRSVSLMHIKRRDLPQGGALNFRDRNDKRSNLEVDSPLPKESLTR